MKKWIWKAIVQKIISYLPMSSRINYVFQKYVTKGVYLTDEYFYDRLGHCKEHLNTYKKYTQKNEIGSCLELGTGWYPIVPIGFYLAGAEKIYSLDISFLTSKERIKTTIAHFVTAYEKGILKDYLPYREDKWAHLMDTFKKIDSISLDEVLKRLQITYLIEDARKLSLPDDSIDLINSNNTFEHIYPEILKPILKEFRRVVNKKNAGVMSHFIDMSDHFAHFDKTITIYNFLRYSDKAWKWIDNSIQPQNRLRIDDYINMYDELKIPITDQSFREGNLEELASIHLAAKYLPKNAPTLAISHAYFGSKMN